jgi:hypothetical protein
MNGPRITRMTEAKKTDPERIEALEAWRVELTNKETTAIAAVAAANPIKEQQLTRLVTSKTSVNTITWQVFSIFSAGMGVMAGAVSQAAGKPETIPQAVALGGFALLATVFWGLLQHRMIGHLEAHETTITRLEKELTHSADTVNAKAASSLRARQLMLLWIGLLAVAWLVTLLILMGVL